MAGLSSGEDLVVVQGLWYNIPWCIAIGAFNEWEMFHWRRKCIMVLVSVLKKWPTIGGSVLVLLFRLFKFQSYYRYQVWDFYNFNLGLSLLRFSVFQFWWQSRHWDFEDCSLGPSLIFETLKTTVLVYTKTTVSKNNGRHSMKYKLQKVIMLHFWWGKCMLYLSELKISTGAEYIWLIWPSII